MRIRQVVPLLVPLFLVAIVTAALGAPAKEQPMVPLQAVEVNSLPDGFGDGPTPFPRPSPPKPLPTPPGAYLSAPEAIYAYAKGVTWFTRRASDGALVFHDCGDPARIETALAAAPEDRVVIVKDLQEAHSADMIQAIGPWRDVYRADIAIQEDLIEAQIPLADVNAGWWAFIAEHAEEVSAAMTLSGPAEVTTCTTGRCDCCTTTVCCPPGNSCRCETLNLVAGDCAAPRASCNVTEPPDPKRSRSADIRWQY